MNGWETREVRIRLLSHCHDFRDVTLEHSDLLAQLLESIRLPVAVRFQPLLCRRHRPKHVLALCAEVPQPSRGFVGHKCGTLPTQLAAIKGFVPGSTGSAEDGTTPARKHLYLLPRAEIESGAQLRHSFTPDRLQWIDPRRARGWDEPGEQPGREQDGHRDGDGRGVIGGDSI